MNGTSSNTSAFRIAAAFALALSLAACDDDTTDAATDADIEVRLVAGQTLNGVAGVTIPNIAFEARNIDDDTPRAGVPINWKVTGPGSCGGACGATVTPTQTVTDANGATAVSVKLGTQKGAYLLIPTTTRADVTRVDTTTLNAVVLLIK